jgi:transcriptional/translational regulatory protein YebC/TACO1
MGDHQAEERAADASAGRRSPNWRASWSSRARRGRPNFNFKLRLVIDKAKARTCPRTTLTAIKRGAGLGGDGSQLEEIT